ncbi:hypothetical protein J2847_006796, partial [Azospirillum agricola]|uniref:hypothetical protein n=1 Tax=Azospirillum agricola TaxID=1720247 RepID=UPI001AE32566
MVMLKGKEYTGAGLGTNFGHKKPTVSGADGQTRDQWENMWTDGLAEVGDRAAAAVEAGESAAASQAAAAASATAAAGSAGNAAADAAAAHTDRVLSETARTAAQ